MAGSKETGKKAAATSKEKFGDDYHALVGALGGVAPAKKPKGLAALSPERRREIASLGGKAGKGKKKKDAHKD